MSAQNYDVIQHRQAVSHRLSQLFTVGRGEYHLIIIALALQMRYSTVDRLYLHHHPCLAAKRIIIDLAVLVGGVFTQIMHHDFSEPLVLRPFQDRAVKRRFKHLGKYGQNVYAHQSGILIKKLMQS